LDIQIKKKGGPEKEPSWASQITETAMVSTILPSNTITRKRLRGVKRKKNIFQTGMGKKKGLYQAKTGKKRLAESPGQNPRTARRGGNQGKGRSNLKKLRRGASS